jgi:hypothetical protein
MFTLEMLEVYEKHTHWRTATKNCQKGARQQKEEKDTHTYIY